MKCSRVRERLMDYIPAELPPRELQQINMHLVGCEACRAEVEKARKASSALKALANESPYPDLVAAVRTRLPGSVQRRPAIMPGLAIGFSAAAMVALIVTGWLRYGDLDRGAATAVAPTGQPGVQQKAATVQTQPTTVQQETASADTAAADRERTPSKAAAPKRKPLRSVAKQGISGAADKPSSERFDAKVDDSDSVILFALRPREPEIYVMHTQAEGEESATELTVVREFDEGGNITSVTISGTVAGNDGTGSDVRTLDRTLVPEPPPAAEGSLKDA